MALQYGNLEVAKALLNIEGVLVNVRDHHGLYPLDYAAALRADDILQLILDKGAVDRVKAKAIYQATYGTFERYNFPFNYTSVVQHMFGYSMENVEITEDAADELHAIRAKIVTCQPRKGRNPTIAELGRYMGSYSRDFDPRDLLQYYEPIAKHAFFNLRKCWSPKSEIVEQLSRIKPEDKLVPPSLGQKDSRHSR